MRDTLIVEEFKKALKTSQHTVGQVEKIENFEDGAALYQMLCPRPRGVPMEKYQKEQLTAASSEAKMLAILKKYVEQGVVIKQGTCRPLISGDIDRGLTCSDLVIPLPRGPIWSGI